MRLVTVWLVLSLMLVSVGFYGRSVGRRNLINRTASELTTDGTRLRRLIEAGHFLGSGSIEAVFEQVRRQSSLDIVRIELRDEHGVIAANIGLEVKPVFPSDFIKCDFQEGEPVIRLQKSRSGPVVVETFAIQWPIAGNDLQLRDVVNREPAIAPDRIGIVEIAARLNGTNARIRRRVGQSLRPPANCLIGFTPDSVSILFVSRVLSNDAGPNTAGTLANHAL